MKQEKKFNISDIKFEPLGNHDRAAFSCENDALTNYIKQQASQDVRRKAAAVYVATPDGKVILGYYTLSQYSIQFKDIPPEISKKLARYEAVSATLLGRLARHDSMKGQGLGELLLMDALRSALLMSNQVASAAVVTDPKDQNAKDFYTRYGFIELPKTGGRLFIPMSTVEELFSKASGQGANK